MRLSKYMPRMVVYFPKYVCLNNPRLAIGYYALVFVVMGIAFYQFMAKERYMASTAVGGDVSITSWMLQRPLADVSAAVQADLTRSFCASPSQFDYVYRDISYTNFSCARLCPQGLPSACMSPAELITVEDGASIFIPTFFREMDAWGNESNHFVPGVGSTRLAFSHRYVADQRSEELYSKPPDMSGDSSDDSSRLLTIVLGPDGEEVSRFERGELVNVTLDEMLDYTKLIEYSDTVSRLILDLPYTRVDDDIVDDVGDPGVTVRLTGVTLWVDLKYTNGGVCQLEDGYPKVVAEGWKGKVCCMSVRGIRSWVTRESTAVVDASGTWKARRYHGVRILFRSSGSFAFYDESALFDGLTTLLIWAQIPMLIVYYFVIFVLGKLSEVYSRVVHQSMSIKDACTGMAARLVGHSSAYLDLVDPAAGGITRTGMHDRLRLVFKDSEDLDESEVAKLVDFVFTGMVGTKGDEEQAPIVGVQDFCSAAGSLEPLSFSSLVRIFDRERNIGYVEDVLNDDTIQVIREEAFQDKSVAKGSRRRDGSYALLQQVLTRHARQRSRFERIQGKVEGTVGSAEEAFSRDEEAFFERRRQEIADQGPPEGRPPVRLGTGATYHGDWIGNTRHGYGLETWPDGSTYEGQFEAGRLHGHAIYRQPNGAKYDGQWRQGKQHGDGVHVSEAGALYEGQFQSGRKNGRGKVFLVDGSTYDGEVVDNMMHGPGEYEWINGNKYVGEWVNNLMHGEGVSTFSDGSVYKGQYRNNEKNGHGTFTWPDGKVYEGQYENNQRSGKGTFRMPDGTKIDGTWKDGKQDGPGTCTAPSGRQQAARWDMGVLMQS